MNIQELEKFKASFDGQYMRLEQNADANWKMLLKIKNAFPYLDIYNVLPASQSSHNSAMRGINIGIKPNDKKAQSIFFSTYNDVNDRFIRVNISMAILKKYDGAKNFDQLFFVNEKNNVFFDETANMDACLAYLKPIIEADCIKANIDFTAEGRLPIDYTSPLMRSYADLKHKFNVDRIQLFLQQLDPAQIESFYQIIQNIRTVFPKIDIYHAGSSKYGYLGFGRKKAITSRVQDFLLVSDLGDNDNGQFVFQLGVIEALRNFIKKQGGKFPLTFSSKDLTNYDFLDWLKKLKGYASEFNMNLEGSGRYPIDYLSAHLQVYDDIAGLEIPMTRTTPLNQILFGPAGTGKTYHTVNHAVEIIDPTFYAEHQHDRRALKLAFDEYIEHGQIKLVTFHQSFSYEDFVEGIRATTEDGQIRYSVESGVFKQLCQIASENNGFIDDKIDQAIDEFIEKAQAEEVELNTKTGVVISISSTELDKLEVINSQGNTKTITKNAIKKYVNHPSDQMTHQDTYTWTIAKYIRDSIDDGHTVSLSEEPNLDKKIDQVIKEFIKKAQEKEIELKTKTGRPFTVCVTSGGKLEALTSVRTLVDCSDEAIKDYLKSSDFETVRSGKSYEWAIAKSLRDEVYAIDEILPANDYEKPNEKKRYVMIIDEINRGNISRIFGELITLIDESKRAGKDNPEALSTILPYSKELLSVPNNLYILGTMNSSDHSLTGLDLALRRRFNFIEMKPDSTPLEGVYIEGIHIKALLEKLNQRIEILLDLQHCIGQAYFMPLKVKPYMFVLKEIFLQKIIPLLQEYFFDDWQKIAIVLNHNQMLYKKYDAQQISKLLGDNNVDVAHDIWQINKDALGQANQYIKIYQDT